MTDPRDTIVNDPTLPEDVRKAMYNVIQGTWGALDTRDRLDSLVVAIEQMQPAVPHYVATYSIPEAMAMVEYRVASVRRRFMRAAEVLA
jgi:hypothetical protein